MKKKNKKIIDTGMMTFTTGQMEIFLRLAFWIKWTEGRDTVGDTTHVVRSKWFRGTLYILESKTLTN